MTLLAPLGAMHLLVMADVLVPLFLLAWKLPRRADARGARAIAAICLLALAGTLPFFLTDTTDNQSTQGLLNQLCFFTILLVVMTILVTLLCDADIWTGLFCATSAYAIQNAASGIELLARFIIFGRTCDLDLEPVATLSFLGASVICYLIFYLFFVRNTDAQTMCDVDDPKMLVVFVVVSLGVIGFDILIKGITQDGISLIQAMLLRIVHLAVCIFVLLAEYQILYQQRVRAESAAMERLLAERARQYEGTRENIEAINIKCHDIRHQIRRLAQDVTGEQQRELESLAHEVNIYDSRVHTNNEALDTILSEEGLVCQREGITLSCIADGGALGFMSAADLYSFFGNALDNAIDAVQELCDPEARSISLVVRQRGDMISIHVENRFAGAVEFRDGLPQTRSADPRGHGLGTRSMRLIAEKYDGSLTFGATGNLFQLDALIPVPHGDKRS